MTAEQKLLVGTPVRRKEDPALLRGAARFVDDLKPSGVLHLGFVHSTQAHADILDIELGSAIVADGVIGACVARDLPESLLLAMTPCARGVERPVLATDRVRFVGEAVAALVAEDQYVLADGLDLVAVDYDPREPVVTIDAALADGSPPLFEAVGSNVVAHRPASDDLAELFASAPHVLRQRFVNQRLAHSPMEPSGVIASWDGDELTLHASCQAPHAVRTLLARQFGLPQSSVRVVVPSVGGAFGSKNAWYPEFTLAPYFARLLGRPVKYTQTRSQAMVAMCHGRDQIQDVIMAYDDDGCLLGMQVDIVQNAGAYPTVDGLVLAEITRMMSNGCYRIPRLAVSTTCVSTNTTPTRPYRGAGRPEATFFLERMMDRIADDLAIDPVELRRRNFIEGSEFPFKTPPDVGAVYDSGDFDRCLDRCLAIVDYPTLVRAQEERRRAGDPRLLGIGTAMFIEFGGVGPSSFFKKDVSREVGGWETSTVRLFPDGSATVVVGTSPHGQGHETAFAQIVADQFGIGFDKIKVIHGDTAAVVHGVGTVGSRSMAVGGSAVLRSAQKVIERARVVAAELLEINPDDLEFRDGAFVVRGSPDKGVDLLTVAQSAYSATDLPVGTEAGLEATTFWEPSDFVYSSGAYCCVVEVDRDTGAVDILRFVAVDDIGTVLNPLLAEGQIHGALTQGIAQALFEQVVYDDQGQPQNPSFMDYLVPSAPEIPRFESAFESTVSPINPLGVKGVGESGTVGAPPAVVNAVLDALSSFDVGELAMPLSPQQVWRSLTKATAVVREEA